MSDLRAAAQQALEALEAMQSYAAAERKGLRICDEAIPALRAALAQQAEPVAGCETEADCTSQPWCRIRGECQRKQAEPVEPHRWEGDNNIESPFNACMHKTYCMTLKQAEPLNLADPAVRKRLASQWGYVPAAQAEPVEPVAWVNQANLASARLTRDRGGQGDTHTWSETRSNYHGVPLYTAPPQRKPLTEEEIDKIFNHLCNTVGASCKTMARAVERAHGIKEN